MWLSLSPLLASASLASTERAVVAAVPCHVARRAPRWTAAGVVLDASAASFASSSPRRSALRPVWAQSPRTAGRGAEEEVGEGGDGSGCGWRCGLRLFGAGEPLTKRREEEEEEEENGEAKEVGERPLGMDSGRGERRPAAAPPLSAASLSPVSPPLRREEEAEVAAAVAEWRRDERRREVGMAGSAGGGTMGERIDASEEEPGVSGVSDKEVATIAAALSTAHTVYTAVEMRGHPRRC